MTAPHVTPMLWPVYGFRNGMKEVVAVCFDCSAASDLVSASERNLYIGEPRYDTRKATPSVPWTRVSFDRAPDNGNARVAA